MSVMLEEVGTEGTAEPDKKTHGKVHIKCFFSMERLPEEVLPEEGRGS